MDDEPKTKNAPMMRCYYEVLGVERDASAEEIKVAYKKSALKWHPDKNSHQADLAHTMFQEITQAYTTLSNPNERSWYDSHRESILRGGDGTDDSEAEGINLWPFFSTACFTGYGDGPNGFYAVYGRLFELLDEEEAKATENTKKTKGSEREKAPLFGTSTTPYAEVKKFYNHWQAFMTAKTFAWCDQYNTTQADSRRVRRLMEQDNKKARDKARKQYNEQIRHLAEYVKKRDKRITEYLAKQQKEKEAQNKVLEERKKKEQEEKQQRLRELKEEREKELAEEMAQLLEEGSEEAMLYQAQEEDSGGKKKKEIYCAACKKVFKSDKQWQSHERSKKHLQNVEALADALMEQELELQENGEGEAAAGEEGQDQGAEDGVEGEEVVDGEGGEEVEVKGEGEEGVEANGEGEVGEEEIVEAAAEEETQGEKEEKEKEENGVEGEKEEATPAEEGEKDEATPEGEKEGGEAEAGGEEGEKEEGEEEEEEETSKGKRGGKQAKPRRRRRAEKESRGAKKGFPCAVCGAPFSSRNKLFVHIKDKNHAQPLGDVKKRTRKGDRDD